MSLLLAEPTDRPLVVLVGMMATGKSSVGRILADRYGAELSDSDEVIERVMGRTVRQIWESDGVAAFRDLESKALSAALAKPGPGVVAAAGGVVLSEANRGLLRVHTPVVWLRAETATLIARLATLADGGVAGHRPLLGDNAAGTISALDAERRPFYAEVADAIIDVDDLSLTEVADAVVAAVDEMTTTMVDQQDNTARARRR